jgi:hypothetical protein
MIGIKVAILASLHMETADDLFETPQGSPRTDKLIAASIQLAKKIMEKIDCDGECKYEEGAEVGGLNVDQRAGTQARTRGFNLTNNSHPYACAPQRPRNGSIESKMGRHEKKT